MLSIPNVVLQPALDEVQGAVTKSAHAIVQVASGVSQWDKDRVKFKASKKQESSSNGMSHTVYQNALQRLGTSDIR